MQASSSSEKTPFNPLQRTSSANPDLDALETDGESLLGVPPQDHSSKVAAGEPKKYDVEAFLQDDASSLHPPPNSFLQFCKKNPIMVMGIVGGASFIVGAFLLVAGIAVSAASYGAASPAGVVLIGLSAAAIGLSLGCFFGCLGGYRFIKKWKPDDTDVYEKKMTETEMSIKKNKALTKADKIGLLSLVAGKRTSKKQNQKLEGDYTAALELRTNPNDAVNKLADSLEKLTFRGAAKGKKDRADEAIDQLFEFKIDEVDYQTVYAKAIEIAYIHGDNPGDKTIEKIIVKGRKKNLSDVQIWAKIVEADRKREKKTPLKLDVDLDKPFKIGGSSSDDEGSIDTDSEGEDDADIEDGLGDVFEDVLKDASNNNEKNK